MILFAHPLLLAPAAFLAGVLMFLAPCTLPIVPGYLAFIAAVPPSDLADPDIDTRTRARRRIVKNALAFVIGFSVIFIVFGTFAAFLGAHIGVWRYTLARIGGLILILFGLTMLDIVRVPLISQVRQIPIPKSLSLGTPQSSFLIGMLFALGWTPCIGPILGSVLFVASVSATALQGALLLGIFSLGLSLPFLLCAILMAGAGRALSRLDALSRVFQIVGGVILIFLGTLMLFNDMGLLISWGYGVFGFLGYDRLLNYL